MAGLEARAARQHKEINRLMSRIADLEVRMEQIVTEQELLRDSWLRKRALRNDDEPPG